MATQTRIQELESDIAALETVAGTEKIVADKREQLEKLTSTAPAKPKKGEKSMSEEDTIELPVDEQEWEKAVSKFAEAGMHLSEMGMPYVKTPGRSLGFPFTIVEDGPDYGKEGEIFAGMDKGAIWKVKEILGAIDVPVAIVNGSPQFSRAACVSKKFMSVWTEQKDSRRPEEGGKGTTYTKATGAARIGAEVTDLGIGS